MAIIELQIFSQALKRMVPMQVILPIGKRYPTPKDEGEKGPFKTLYLLHGLRGNFKDWIVYTDIQNLAEEKNLAVVMPSGENSCYVNQLIEDHDFGAYIGEELVELTRNMFPLSHKREDTFLGGLSMGGFGALRNGFKYWKNFGYIIALSSAVHFFETPLDQPIHSIFHEEQVFGDRTAASQTDKNPRVAFSHLKKLCDAGEAVMPEIYMACGTEDSLLWANQSLRDFLLENGASIAYSEPEGNHNWSFWNSQIPKFLHWLPLEASEKRSSIQM